MKFMWFVVVSVMPLIVSAWAVDEAHNFKDPKLTTFCSNLPDNFSTGFDNENKCQYSAGFFKKLSNCVRSLPISSATNDCIAYVTNNEDTCQFEPLTGGPIGPNGEHGPISNHMAHQPHWYSDKFFSLAKEAVDKLRVEQNKFLIPAVERTEKEHLTSVPLTPKQVARMNEMSNEAWNNVCVYRFAMWQNLLKDVSDASQIAGATAQTIQNILIQMAVLNSQHAPQPIDPITNMQQQPQQSVHQPQPIPIPIITNCQKFGNMVDCTTY